MPHPTTAQAIVVDDHPLFRRGVVELLNESNCFHVTQSYGSALELIENLPKTAPDLLLLDLQMPDMSGIEALKVLRPQLTETKIVMLTMSMDSHSLVEAIRTGADGYLLKDTDSEQILNHLLSVLKGEIAITDSAVTLLAQGLRSQTTPPQISRQTQELPISHEKILTELTERERQTLELISKGLSNKLIARELGISDGTVKVYVKNLLRKLNLHSRLELAAWNHRLQATQMDETP